MSLLGVFARKEHEVNIEKAGPFAVCRTLGGELSEGVFLGFLSRKDFHASVSPASRASFIRNLW